jgi:hypothetical protein
VVGAAAAQLLVDLCDLALEIVDQLKARVDAATPWLRYFQAIEQLTAGYPKRSVTGQGCPKRIVVE